MRQDSRGYRSLFSLLGTLIEIKFVEFIYHSGWLDLIGNHLYLLHRLRLDWSCSRSTESILEIIKFVF